MDFNWLAAVALFFVSLALDAVFALYTMAVIKTKAVEAGSWSFIIYLLMAIGTVSYVENKWYIVPLALGAFVGTFLIVKREELQKTKKRNT